MQHSILIAYVSFHMTVEVVYSLNPDEVIAADSLPHRCHPDLSVTHRYCPTCGKERIMQDASLTLQPGFSSPSNTPPTLASGYISQVCVGGWSVELPRDLHFTSWPCKPCNACVDIVIASETTYVKQAIYEKDTLQAELARHGIVWDEAKFKVQIRGNSSTCIMNKYNLMH